jgi:thiol:disulfide interchange protein DsbC
VSTIRHRLISVLAALALAGSAQAAPQAPAEPAAAPRGDARAQIAKRLEIKVEDVKPSPVAGLYEVRSGAEVGYVSTDGRFYLDGDVFDMTSKHNLTEDVRKQGRLALLDSVKDADAIVFEAKGAAKHTVTVFTDVDCVHCRHMHSEIAEINKLGIRVRYLMFPRGGPGSDSWGKAVAVWCSADRKDALTRAKRGETLPAGKCASPVAAQYELGRKLGITGTPGIVTDTGEFVAGYATAAYLAAYLDDPSTASAASD